VNKCVLAFISDHGFGHAARSCVILKTLMEQGISITIVSAVPRWFFEDKFANTPNRWRLLEEKVDVGLFQQDALKSDLPKTAKALDLFWQKPVLKMDKIMAFVGENQPTLTYTDISALGVLVAKRLNIPVVALGNFSWDWIYQDLIAHEAESLSNENKQSLKQAIQIHQQLYSKVDKLLQLPYPGDFSAFKNADICPINWVGEKHKSSRNQTLSKLKLEPANKYILFSFGGHTLPDFTLENWPENCELQPLVITQDKKVIPRFSRSNHELSEQNITYADVISAASIIVTKPGYGILTDCIFNQIPMIHMPRGRFAEYPTLLQALDENLNHIIIQTSELSPANIIKHAKALLSQKPKISNVPLNGLEQAVYEITKML